MRNIDILKPEDDDPKKHPRNCYCEECMDASEAIYNGTDEVAQNIPDSERRVKDRRPRIIDGPI